MNKEQQIEETAKCDLCYERFGKCPYKDRMYCADYRRAVKLYNAGYRKTFTSDLASDTQKAFKEGYIKGNIDGMLLARKETAKEILILLGKGFDETKMTEFKNLPWYKLFCRELKHRYGVEV